MKTETEQLQSDIARTFDRVLLLGVLGFLAIVIFAVAYPFTYGSAPYWFFGLAVLLLGSLIALIYRTRTEPLRAAISAEIMADAAIRSSRDLFTQVYKNSPVPYLLVHLDGSIESSNTAAIRLLRTQEADLLNKNIFDFLVSNQPEHLEIVRERLAHGIALSNEELMVATAKGAERTWVVLSLFFFTDVRQRKLGLLTLFDVTKQKEVDIAKSEFVSLASHQLRTPIAGMRWNTELLMGDQRYPLPAPQQQTAQRLLKSIERLSALVDDFLHVSRFELGDLVANPVVTDVQSFIDDIVTEQQAVIVAKGIRLELPQSDQLSIRIVTDNKLLAMIVTNFLVNALKYTPANGVVSIGVRRDSQTLSITVADNGIGIPVAEQSRLFSKMFRASNAQREITDGTGLGLYIAKRAAQVLRGQVSFTSGEGVGSAFTVTIPLEIVL